MYSKTAEVLGQCLFLQINKLVPALVPAACRTACTLYTWRRWSRPPPPTSDLNIFLSKSNKSVTGILPFLNPHGLTLKLHKICTQKLPKFLDNFCFYTQTSWWRLWSQLRAAQPAPCTRGGGFGPGGPGRPTRRPAHPLLPLHPHPLSPHNYFRSGSFKQCKNQCWGSVTFWCGSGSGSSDPYL
jgi:hypothetical protein